MIRPVAAIALAVAPSIAAAQPIAPRFDPPLDRELRYEVVEERPLEKATLRFRLDQRVVFSRAGDGYRMAVTLRSADSDAPADIAKRFEGAFRPFVGLVTVLELSATGAPLGLVDEEALWERLSEAVDRLRADAALDPKVAAGVSAAFSSIAALPPAAREAKLSEAALRVLGYALPPLPLGDAIVSGDDREGATVRLTAADERALTYGLDTRKPLTGDAAMLGEGTMLVDRATGLLQTSTMRERIRASANAPPRAASTTTIRRLDP